MGDKRGQGLSTSTIILLILGVVILVVLVLGFSIGWGKVLPFLSSNNVETIKTSCTAACATDSVYEYCTVQRQVTDGVNPKFSDNCFNLADANNAKYSSQYKNYGISPCPTIACP